MANPVQLNLDTYVADSTAGKTQIVKLNGVVHFTARKFNPEDGTPQPQLIAMNRDDVLKHKELVERHVAALTKLLADIDAAAEKLA